MLLSVIIPVYNAEKYLEACVNSILGQRMEQTSYEIILVDDGSQDGSPVVCDNLAEQYKNITVLHLPNGGPSAARNAGIDAAKGEYVQFIDADDEIDQACFEQMECLLQKEKTDLVITGAKIVDTQKQVLQEQKSEKELIFKSGHVGDFLLHLKAEERHWALYYIWNKWYRCKKLKEYGIRFDTSIRLGEDFIFNCAYYRVADSVSVMDKALYLYYKREVESLTNTVRVNELARRQFVDHAYNALYQDLGIYDDYRDTLKHIQGEMAYVSMDSIFYTRQQYNMEDKVRFIKQFMESEYNELILNYLHQCQSQIKNIECFFLRRGAYRGFIRFKTAYLNLKKNR